MAPETNSKLVEIGEQILSNLDGINGARERALAETRQIVRLSANCIRAVHRGDYDQAKELLAEARSMQDALSSELADYPGIYWSGYVRDAQKEYAEASLTLAILAGRDWPEPADLNVEDAVYLNGLGEVTGELRRHALDEMRQGNLDRAEEMLAIMNDIYDLLVTVDYPDAVTGGLRRTTDLARGVTERTRGDLTVALQQRKLTEALERAETRFANDRTSG
ncbi:MAG: haloacid dehalogenase [Chloroflexota bacterium]